MTALSSFAATMASAQSSQAPESGTWRYGASVYGYLPPVDGKSSNPVDSGGSSIDISAKQILDALKMVFMGSFSAHNGRWGGFTDLVYIDLGASKQQSRDFTIGNAGLPASTTANLDYELKGLAWMLGGDYRLRSEPGFTLDVLAGARLLNLRQTLQWDIAGDLGPIQPSGRTGSSRSDIKLWDGIIGVKGRASFGSMRQWSVPLHLDVGTGQSDITWQVAGGISYAFQWGELTGMWRYLAYEMKPGQGLANLNFNGPMVGATFRW